MNLDKVVNELYFFALEPRIFKFKELLEFVDININPKLLRKRILEKSRFIYLNSDSQNDDYFILDSVLFKWLCQLNLRLVKLKKSRLNEHQITNLINLLCAEGKFELIPKNLIRWGQSIGLICLSFTKGEFVFPLAQTLSYIKQGDIETIKQILRDFCEIQIWNSSLKKYKSKFLKKGFSAFSERIAYIIQRREALHRGKRETLQEIGDKFNMTRERIRQLEKQFWNTLTLKDSYRKSFIEAFLCDYMINSGSLVIDKNSHKAPLRRFIAKCIGIPRIELSDLGLIVLARLNKRIVTLKPKKNLLEFINAKIIAHNIENNQIDLSRNDVQRLAKKISQNRHRKLDYYQRAYISLYKIGKPAHYSKITKVYNSLWQDHQLDERSLHNALVKQKHGIVWIGIKGTYALKEWGYERPKKTLYETVTEIVKRKYDEIGKPISIPMITSELGKYRRIVKSSSLSIVIFTNTKIRRVSKDSFVPIEDDDNSQEEISLNELDNIIKKFEKNLKKQTKN